MKKVDFSALERKVFTLDQFDALCEHVGSLGWTIEPPEGEITEVECYTSVKIINFTLLENLRAGLIRAINTPVYLSVKSRRGGLNIVINL